MDVRLDRDVYTNDGEKVGTVDEVVIHPETMQLEAFLVREGFLFTQDRIVEPEFVDHVDGEGNVYLNITKDREEDLPAYVERKYVRPDDSWFERDDVLPWFATAGGRVLAPADPVDSRSYPAPSSPARPAALDPEPMVVESNLPENTVLISEGSDVVDSTGDKIGTVDDILFDEDDAIEGFIVKEGVIFKHHVRIPVEWVDDVTDDYIRINRTADQAEAAGRLD